MTTAAPAATDRLLEVARSTLAQLRQQDVERSGITLDSALTRDLGLDSLARVELFTRIEAEFGTRLPESLFEKAETLRDIRVALDGGAPATNMRAVPAPAPEHAAIATSTPPAGTATLMQALSWHVDRHPDFVQITLCGDGPDVHVSYARLQSQARLLAGGLQRQGLRSGDTVALMLPTSADYFFAFFGVLLAGGVPVPLYPPTRLSQIEEHVRRHTRILENSQAVALITTPEMHRLAAVLRLHAPTLRRIVTCDELRDIQAMPAPVATGARATAFLQYTSGSTGQPKGVVLSHENLLENISALGAAAQVTGSDVFVSWLPLYHDMGLIGAWLAPLYFGLPLVVMSPLRFLARPVRWLEAIQRYRGTLSAAPNFAFELCLKRVTDEDLAGLDLRTWRLAMNGAEAVMPATLERFQERFARCGFRPGALTPVYGLAESSVGLTFPPLDRGPLIDVIDREAFMKSGVAAPAGVGAHSPLRFVSCGAPLRGHEVRIVDDAGREVGERHEGRLEFRGPSATQGYFRNAQATATLLRDGWLDSGDRAYCARGEIYPTGRIKDIIIRAGRHIYPDELESAVGAVSGVRKGCVAVFGGRDQTSGTERVVVMAETNAQDPEARSGLRRAITERIVSIIGEPPDDVVLVAPHTVLKTSSGKLRRAASRELYEQGHHRRAMPRAGWLQLLRLLLSAAVPIARRLMRRTLELLYATWFWALFLVLAGAVYVCILPPLRTAARWNIAHLAARALIRLAFIPFAVRGRENLNAAARQIIIANHSSYLDGVFLVAALKTPCRFVAKRELARMPLVGATLRRLGAEFIERFDARASVEGARRLADIAGSGPSCIFFPEGTFTRAPGLSAFHLGAFAAAVTSGLPVLPVALHGTRSLLRDEQWLPRRVAVEMTIGPPIEAPKAADAFAATVQLRDAARESIRRHSGEPDLFRSG